MDVDDLLHTLENLPRPRLLVIGDLMLDRYTYGAASRISQEAPVIVLQASETEDRLGGAANTANMAQGLLAEVTCVGVVGQDDAGAQVRELLQAAGIDAVVFTDASRPTTLKERFIGRAGSRHPSQILRVDREDCREISVELAEKLAWEVADRAADCDAVIISDYGKGLCSPALLRRVIAAARAAGAPVLVDPARGGDFSHYRGATLLKPNRPETELATGLAIQDQAGALIAARRLCQDYDAQLAVVTLDRDGMALVAREAGVVGDGGRVFPSKARAVYDITGAGDMVMAMLGVCLGSGISPASAVQLANIAGGLEVEKAGVAIVTREEIVAELQLHRPPRQRKLLSLEEAAALAARRRALGARVVFTNGCFDLLHVGHVSYLTEAAALGDLLIVGVNSDASVRKLKGPERPVIGETDRAAMLAALACVEAVVVFDDDTPHRLLHAIRPNVLVKGGTYTPQEVVGREVVQAYGGQVLVTGMTDGISTTRIIQSILPAPARSKAG